MSKANTGTKEREIRMLQRAGISTASAELLLVRMRAKVGCASPAPHLPGGLSGLSVHLRTAGFWSGSTSQFVQTNRSRRWPVSSGTRFIGLPHDGHGLRMGWSINDI